MAGQGRAELEPRDVVSRAVWKRLGEGHRVFLDTRAAFGVDLPKRFPTIAAACRAAGIDPVTAPMPIRPATHYHMGGIAVDTRGRTTLPGLWACGEAASTGLHGANRLASNSMLEAAVTGLEVARDLAGRSFARIGTPLRPRPQLPTDPAGLLAVRQAMSAHVGVLRDRAGLEQAMATIAPIAAGTSDAASPAIAGLMIASAAWRRTESRGGHSRTDFPARDDAQAVRRPITLREAWRLAEEVAGVLPTRLAGTGD